MVDTAHPVVMAVFHLLLEVDHPDDHPDRQFHEDENHIIGTKNHITVVVEICPQEGLHAQGK